ncbi:MAG: ABC transporter ATP-binding protein [Lachnospiraceae bacterium]
MKKIIEVKHLYKYYRVGDEVVRALDGLDFSINEGEFCAIIGTSGSGKSTLLNMLAGLEHPTKGSICINGTSIEGLDEDDLVKFRRNHVGFIFQSYQLISTMTALENVALPLSFRGEGKKSRLIKAHRMLDKVALKEHKNHMPTQLSGGQQQRVGVARALVVDPQIIFADEPTGNLDTHTSRDVLELMQSIVKNEHKTLVMVTHDESLAAYADKIIKIIDGKIVSMEENKKNEVLEEDIENEKI